MNIKIEWVRTFVFLAQARSVREAANQSGVSTSTIARYIGLYEKALGFVLFDGSPKASSLTSDGVKLLAKLQPIFAEIDGVHDQFKDGAPEEQDTDNIQPKPDPEPQPAQREREEDGYTSIFDLES